MCGNKFTTNEEHKNHWSVGQRAGRRPRRGKRIIIRVRRIVYDRTKKRSPLTHGKKNYNIHIPTIWANNDTVYTQLADSWPRINVLKHVKTVARRGLLAACAYISILCKLG